MSDRPTVLFVCVHNAGRSQMAAALLHHRAAGAVTVLSAGSDPADQVNPAVVQVMAEISVDISQEFPKPLTNEAVETADVVITMGCGDACPVYPGKRYLDWELTDPAGKAVEEVRPIRDEIDRRVTALLAELVGAADGADTTVLGTDREQLRRVRDRYAGAARQLATDECELADGAVHYADEAAAGLPVTASLGCGNPVAVADLRPGETVLDLGSGAGLDVLLSARRVGPTGRAIGLDMTDEMLELARRHAAEAGAENVEFLRGHIEDIPLPDESVDVVISNCVITLSANKPKVFAEIARVLRPGGRVGITDVIAEFSLTDAERAERGDRVECLASSLTTDQYVAVLATAGLADLTIRTTHPVDDKLRSAIVRAAKPKHAAGAPVRIAPMTAAHAGQVLAIYQAGLDTGNASFETTAAPWKRWDAAHLDRHRFVALEGDDTVIGWVAAAPVSSRPVYAGVLEHSIYIHPDHRGRGLGRALLAGYIAAAEAAGAWTLQTGIFPENQASLALHHNAGFRTVGRRERIGQHHGRWRDVILIEHRATTP